MPVYADNQFKVMTSYVVRRWNNNRLLIPSHAHIPKKSLMKGREGGKVEFYSRVLKTLKTTLIILIVTSPSDFLEKEKIFVEATHTFCTFQKPPTQ